MRLLLLIFAIIPSVVSATTYVISGATTSSDTTILDCHGELIDNGSGAGDYNYPDGGTHTVTISPPGADSIYLAIRIDGIAADDELFLYDSEDNSGSVISFKDDSDIDSSIVFHSGHVHIEWQVNGNNDDAGFSVRWFRSTAVATIEKEVTCGGNDGEIAVFGIGTASPFSYSWSNGVSGTNRIDTLSARTYSISVTDGDGCETLVKKTLEAPQPISGTIEVLQEISCGETDGSLSAVASGGSAPYTYAWEKTGDGSFSESSSTITNLDDGEYTVTITDSKDCPASFSKTLTNPVSPTATIQINQDPNCVNENGSIEAIASGGDGQYTYAWKKTDSAAFTSDQQTLSSLKSGEYTLTITDGHNCTATAAKTLPVYQSLSFVKDTVNPTCPDYNNGEISLFASGGSGTYQYSIDNGTSYQALRTFTDLPEADYTLLVRDANNTSCVSSAESAELQNTASPTVSITINTMPDCNNTNGSIQAIASGGNGQYTYSWKKTDSAAFTSDQQSLSSLKYGEYTVTVTDGNNCTGTAVKILSVYESPTFIKDTVNPTCPNYNNGQITLFAAGGSGTYQYSIDNGTSYQASRDFTGLSASDYTLLVRDANNITCVSSIKSAKLQNTASPTVSITVDSLPDCNIYTGAIQAIASGGNGQYTYDWKKTDSAAFTSDQQTLSSLKFGEYTVTVTDGNNCSGTAVKVLPVYQSPTFIKDTVNPTCPNYNNGQITLFASGGSGTYQYSIDNGTTYQTSRIFTGLTEADYTLLVRDADNTSCVSPAQSAELQKTASPTVSITVDTLPDCNGTNGMIHAIASGGNGQYQYAWGKTGDAGFSSDQQTLSSLSAGEYTVTVTDGNNCTGTSSVVLPEYEPLVVEKDTLNPTCPAFDNGLIVLFASGGSGLYEYSINNGVDYQNNSRFASLTAGQYDIVVQDKMAAGCTVDTSVQLANPELPSVAVAGRQNPLCFGDANGSIKLSVTGGAGGYEYQWASVGGSGLANEDGAVQTELTAGIYSVTVTDKKACQQVETDIELTQNLALNVEYQNHQDIAIFGQETGMISVEASGGDGNYSYAWNAENSIDSSRIENLKAGTYTVTVTDGNNCAELYSRTLTQPALLTAGEIQLQSGQPDSVVCADSVMPALQSVALPTGGQTPYIYSWQFSADLTTWNDSLVNAPSYAPNDSVSASYSVRRKVVDAAGSIAYSNTVTVQQQANPNVAIANLAPQYCTNKTAVTISGIPVGSGASAVFSGSAAITDNGNGTALYNPLLIPAGNDTVIYRYTDQYGCSNTAKVGVAIADTAEIEMIVDRVVNIGSPEEPIVATPPGGVLSGPGVYAQESKFLPNVAGLGSHTITYQFTTPDGCFTQMQKQVVVATATARIIGIPDNGYACIDAGSLSLIAEGEIKEVVSFSGPHLVLTDSVHAVFDPVEAGVGTFQIDFTYIGVDDVTYTITEYITVVQLVAPSLIGFGNRFCVDDNSTVLKAVPSGGTFSGPGISDAGSQHIFNPAEAGVVDDFITYEYTDELSGCSIDTTEELHVYPLPEIEQFTLRRLFNKNEASYEIEVLPTGGEFIVNNLSQGLSNSFVPSAVDAGMYDVEYRYTDTNGCVVDSVRYTEVAIAEGTFNAPAAIVCYDAQPDTLIGTNPYKKGSTFLGDGIVNIGADTAVFYPNVAGSGYHTIVYQYAGPDSIAQFSVSAVVDVDSVGTLRFIDLAGEYCQSAGIIEFSAAPESNLGIHKGDFSGTGISNGVGNDGLARLFVDEVTPGDSTLITYTYTDQKFCSATAETWVVINPLPTIETVNAKEVYNAASGTATLSAVPTGGVFSSNSIGIIDGTFNPDKEELGTHSITYTYTDLNECISHKTVTVTIAEAEAQIESIVLDRSYCDYAAPDTIYGNTRKYQTVGQFTERIGLRNIGNNQAVIYPDSLGSGAFNVEFIYPSPDKLEQFTVSETITVESLSAVRLLGLQSSFCVSDQAQAFSVENTNVGGEHSFVYNGDAKGLSFTGTDAYFYPNLISPGEYTVQYTYTSPSGCVVADSQHVSVYGLPLLDFSIKELFNVTDPAYKLEATPVGGMFSGVGVSGEYFLPSVAGVQANLPVEYFYTDTATNCSSFIQHTTGVVQSQAAIEGIESVYCRYQPKDSLFGIAPEGIFYQRFYLDSMLVSDSDTLVLTLDSLEAGEHSVRFQYAFPDTSVVFYKDYTFEIFDIGSISIDGLADEYCVSATDVKLYGFPFGGNFTGKAITGDVYSPSGAGAGFDTVWYQYEKTFYNRYSAEAAEKQCVWQIYQPVAVHALPEVTMVGMANGQEICSNAQPVSIIANYKDGSFTGPSLIVENDTALFTPTEKIVGDRTISFTYTDTNSCTNSTALQITVTPVPVLSFDGLEANYCISAEVAELKGNHTDGYFYGNGVADADSLDGLAIFDPALAGEQLRDSVFYRYTNEFSCTQIVGKEVSVHLLPPVSLSGYNDEYCQFDEDVELVGSPKGSGGVYYIDGLTSTTLKTLSTSTHGEHSIGYTFTDVNGCVDSVSDIVTVHPAPQASFSIDGQCAEDTVVFRSTATSVDSIVNWIWTLGKSEGVDDVVGGVDHAQYYYQSGGTKKITLQVETINQCTQEITAPIELIHAPEVIGEWSKTCGDAATVSFREVTGVRSGHTFHWDFGDGYSADSADVEHTYFSAGKYSARLTVNAESGCMVVYYMLVDVKPVVDEYPYIQDFENGPGGWSQPVVAGHSLPLEQQGSWQLAEPKKEIISGAASGAYAWVTSAAENYKPEEQSYVESPCFDLSALKKPMVKFNLKVATDPGRDGAVLQVSTDNGYTWETLGEEGTGLAWYNASGLVGNPGGQDVDQLGWTGSMNDQWYSARHSLDKYAGADSVRFRIAFGADGSVQDEGAVFDDFWVGERSKLVLLERFVGAGTGSQIASERVAQFTQANPLDVIDVAYHLGVDGFDPYYSAHPEAGNNRATNYRVQEVPYLIVDGNYLGGSLAETIFDQTDLQLRTLEDPLFNLTVNAERFENDITVSLSVSAVNEISLRNVRIQTVVLEQNTNYAGNAVHAILPDAAGEILTKPWASGETVNFTYSYNEAGAEDITVVAYVQDVETQEIYQVAFDESYLQVITGHNSQTVSLNGHSFFYPTPASKTLYFHDDETLTASIELYTTTGVLVRTEGGNALSVQGLSSGPYIACAKNAEGAIICKQLVFCAPE